MAVSRSCHSDQSRSLMPSKSCRHTVRQFPKRSLIDLGSAKMPALSRRGENCMRPVRIISMVLTAVLAISGLLCAQTAPDITLPPGDAIRGKTIFESSKGNCQTCHRVNGTGSAFGPDLSAIGAPPRGGGIGGRGGGANARGAAPAPPTGPTPQQLAQ